MVYKTSPQKRTLIASRKSQNRGTKLKLRYLFVSPSILTFILEPWSKMLFQRRLIRLSTNTLEAVALMTHLWMLRSQN